MQRTVASQAKGQPSRRSALLPASLEWGARALPNTIPSPPPSPDNELRLTHFDATKKRGQSPNCVSLKRLSVERRDGAPDVVRRGAQLALCSGVSALQSGEMVADKERRSSGGW